MRKILVLGLMLLAHPVSAGSWYWCEAEKAYFPYVQTCSGPWREVPAQQVPTASPPQATPKPAPIDQPTILAPPPADQGPKQQSAAKSAVGGQGRGEPDSDTARLIQREETLNEMCRGGSGDDPGTQKACDLRDGVVTQLKAKGWCYGHEPQIMADRKWEKCTASFVPKPAAPNGSSQSVSPPVNNINAGPCKDDWRGCKDNADLVNNFSKYYRVQAACQTAADKDARYGTPKWPGFWDGGAFGRFLPGTDYVSTGIVTAIENEAQFQNGFGAMVHSTVICKYDLARDSVVGVDIVAH